MKSAWYRLLLGFFCYAILIGCNSKPFLDVGTAESPPTTGSTNLTEGIHPVTGEIFIVLKNRETLKLSGVQVQLLDVQAAAKVFAKRAIVQSNYVALLGQHSAATQRLKAVDSSFWEAMNRFVEAKSE